MGEYPSLVATDLDGTIIRGDGTISARTVAAFARVEAAGARFVLVTGRPPRWMAAIAATFGHRGTAICANGALAYDMHTGEIEARHLIPPPVLAAAATALRAAAPGIGIAVEYPDGHAADPVYESVNWDVNLSLPRLDDAELFSRPASKLLGRHFGYTCDDLLTQVLPALDGLVSVTHSNSKGLIEASALGVSKASVVAEIAALHGIDRESVIAFGDMPNDLPLLTWAGISCAVANAHPAVLAAATHVIGSNDEDGVATYLEALYT
ncbi:HAD-IIB family hydrolase [Trebonia kvetii]|uniref:HAD-IIB family hydrolase n=1 Tax=Trebonia kvetii TaxID=2480626 RepID=A0A6P2BQ82_9ACTN|nr:HAD-IIB family hydrolase [Trebonia kvetii]TVZ01120.1 HAD-IIB family hydrolase [Trebonia kvetii]